MAKSRTAKSGVAPQQLEKNPIRNPLYVLSLEEREALKVLLNSPVFVKAWRNLQWAKPSAFPKGWQGTPAPLNSPLGAQIGNNLLHEIRGWELCESALLRQINDPPPLRTNVSENWQAP